LTQGIPPPPIIDSWVGGGAAVSAAAEGVPEVLVGPEGAGPSADRGRISRVGGLGCRRRRGEQLLDRGLDLGDVDDVDVLAPGVLAVTLDGQRVEGDVATGQLGGLLGELQKVQPAVDGGVLLDDVIAPRPFPAR